MKTKLLFSILVVAQLNVLASPQPDKGFVAHEWGTFTSVQGADGIQLEWNPLVVSELPDFVYDRNRSTDGSRARRFADFSSKSAFICRQRMETPVIYFYSEQPREVDVSVQFPQGLVTEWYPQLSPLQNTKENPTFAQNHGIRWSNIQIVPMSETKEGDAVLPVDKSGSHYYSARETDANMVRIRTVSTHKFENEKFLFYRGIGNFQAPLQVTMSGNEDQVSLMNNGTDSLANLYVLQIQKGMGKFSQIKKLAPGASAAARLFPGKGLMPISELQEQISAEMAAALAGQGLYPAEAKAMVNTWRDSWFGEDGTRVLYILPRSWTDQVLPLNIEPKPRDILRVMVGRAEVLPPSKEWQLLKQIVRFTDPDTDVQQKAVAEARELGFGRFAEPAVRHLSGKIPGREFGQVSWAFLEATKPSKELGKSLAIK